MMLRVRPNSPTQHQQTHWESRNAIGWEVKARDAIVLFRASAAHHSIAAHWRQSRTEKMSEHPEVDDQAINDEMASMFDLKQKKKKKTKKVKDEGAKGEEGEAGQTETATGAVGEDAGASSSKTNPLEPDPPSYTYLQLLNRVVDFVHQVRYICCNFRCTSNNSPLRLNRIILN